jgi:ATP-dependent protease HslVU (ClpYQ) peptidase subunit
VTTIAYKNGIMAGDSRITAGEDEISPGAVRKVFRLSNGTLIGFAGTLAKIQEVMKQLRKTPSKIDFKVAKGEELHALIVYSDGVVRELDSEGWTEIKAPYYAIGTGSLVAKVAMACDKSPAEAVRMAMKFDKNTGGKVQIVKLD